MKEHEFKVIKQRLAVSIDNHQDAVALAREVEHLRAILRDIKDTTGDPAIIAAVRSALEEE